MLQVELLPFTVSSYMCFAVQARGIGTTWISILVPKV